MVARNAGCASERMVGKHSAPAATWANRAVATALTRWACAASTEKRSLSQRTVRSRTMRLTFGRLPVDDIVQILVRDHAMAETEARRLG